MVRIEIPTTYSDLQVNDIIWIDDQPWSVTVHTNMGDGSGATIVTARDPQGGVHVLAQLAGDLVYRQARD